MTEHQREHDEQPTERPPVCGESETFARLVAALTEASVPFVHTHHPPVFTSAEAAAARGTELCSGAKALIVKGRDGFTMAVIPADLTLHSNVLRKHLGSKRMRFATKDEVWSITGLTPGSIPPFGSLFGLDTICDIRLAENDRINFNAGSHTESFQMGYEAYIAYEKPQIAEIAKLRPPPQEP